MEQSCGGCPTVFDLETDDGEQYYLRYRWGYIALKIPAGIPLNGNPEVAGEQLDDEWAGIISQEEAIQWLEKQGHTVQL